MGLVAAGGFGAGASATGAEVAEESLSGAVPALPELGPLSAGWLASAAGGAVSDGLADAGFAAGGLVLVLPLEGELGATCAGCVGGWAVVSCALVTGAEAGWIGAAG